MSPEIQEWSHKSRFRISNLYLLTRPIALEQRGNNLSLDFSYIGLVRDSDLN